MPLPLIQPALGLVDGFNTIFFTSAAYVPGSLQVWLNGQLKRADFLDGWIELGSNKFQMKVPPQLGDEVGAFFKPL